MQEYSSDWFQELVGEFDAYCFPYGKIKFIRPNGKPANQPGTGSVLFAAGAEAVRRLFKAKLGLTQSITRNTVTVSRGRIVEEH